MFESGQWHEEASPDLLANTLADSVAASLAAAIEARGEACLVVSGGSTPLGFFQRLAGKSLDWSRVSVTLADERWLDPGHEDSNERMVRNTLLTGAASAARFLSLTGEGAHPSDALELISARLSPLKTFDVVVLGMGGDGHTASLFPGAEALTRGLDLASGLQLVAVDPPVAPYARISMTLPRLLDSRRLILHITGAAKKTVLETALAEGDPRSLPIAAFLRLSQPALEVYWAP